MLKIHTDIECTHKSTNTWHSHICMERSHTHTHRHTTIYINHHLSNAGFPAWHRVWVMNRVGKVQNPNSFGRDLFSFPLITMQLLTDSQHSQHSHNVFLAFQTCRQTGWEKRGGEKWEGEGKMERKEQEKSVCVWGGISLCSLLSRNMGAAGVWCSFGCTHLSKRSGNREIRAVKMNELSWVIKRKWLNRLFKYNCFKNVSVFSDIPLLWLRSG